MATAAGGGDGGAAAPPPPVASYKGGGGGAGGKFPKRPFRRTHTTPYDRPPTALRNPSQNGSWISKLIVDPASKLISAGAQRLFSSVFRKRLPPPPLPPPPELNQGSNERLQGTVSNNCAGKEETDIDADNNANSSDGIGISELEQILKHKSFTRSEIERLTELLQAKTLDSSTGDVKIKTEANPLKAISHSKHEDDAGTLIQENNSTPFVPSKVPDYDVATPAELAKAYMGSRPKVSPSMLGLRSLALREDASITSKAPIMLPAPKGDRVEIIKNGFTTPRARGRSALYSMARTPYSRILPTASPKGFGSFGYGGRLSASNPALGHDERLGSKQLALKRRSSVLDDDVGSVGPMRRIRQKPNLLSQGSSLPLHGTGFTSNRTQQSSLSTQKLILADEPRHKVLKTVGEREDYSFPSTSYTPVPSKSSEMATKILQHLEKLTPKERSSSPKFIAAIEKSPAKLMPNMHHGQALRSLEDVDSSKMLQKIQDSNRFEDVRNIPDAGESTSKQEKVEVNGPRQFAVSSEMLNCAVNADTTVLKYDVPNVKIRDSVSAKSVAQPLKKRAFQMSAHEDFLEVDDDIHSNGPTYVSEEKEKLQTSVVDSKASSAEASFDKAPALLDVKKPDLITCDGSSIGEKKAVFSLPTSQASGTFTQPSVLGQSTSELEKEPNGTSLSFSSKPDDKIPLNTFSSPTVNVSSGPKSSAWSDPKAEIKSSMANVAPVASNAQFKIHETDNCDDISSQRSGKLVEISEKSSGSILASSSSMLSFAPPTNISTLNNGPQALSTSIFSSSSSVLASTNFSGQSVGTPSAISSSVANHTASSASDGSLAAVTAAPSVPTFKSTGISLTPAAVLTASAAETATLNAKMGTETSSGNLISLSSSSTAFSMASTGSGIIGAVSSVTSSNVNNQSQASGVSPNTTSQFNNVQVAPTGSGAVSSQSMPVQFGSTAPFPSFGVSGISSFTSGGTPFGTSNPAAILFSSGNVFGQISSASTLETNPISSNTGATSTQFSFGLSSSASSGLTPVSSSSGATSSTFSFGLSSSASSSETNSVSSSSGATNTVFAPNWQSAATPVFGSIFSSPSPSTGFSFGAFSSASAASSAGFTFAASSSAAATSSMGFSLGGSSSASASSAGLAFGASSSSAAATGSTGFSFGASSAASASPEGFAFVASSSSAATPRSMGFSFGESSSASATSSTPMTFESTGHSSSSLFSFTSAATTSSIPSLPQMPSVFGSPSNGDQMNMEDSMAEDPVQASTFTVPAFGQQPVSPSPGGFVFGTAAQPPAPATTFAFSATQQNQGPFLGTGSGSIGGSFSLGTSGDERSSRKIVKVSRTKNRKK